MTRRAPRGGTGWSLLAAEVSLAALMVVAVLGMRRLFDSWDYLPTFLTLAAASHLVAAVTRRQRWPLAASAAVSAISLVLLLGVLVYRDTLFVIVPSFETWRTAAQDLADAWDAFGVVKAPTPAADGFLVAGGTGVWLLAFGADAAAFRLRTAVEALAPAVVLFLFVGVLGVESGRLASTAAVLGCAALFTLMHRIVYPVLPSVPIAATRERQPSAQLKVGLSIAAAAVVAGMVFGPILPGVDATPVIDWKDLDGSSSGPRVTLSPLVDARGRLIEQSRTELFRVRADRPSYWRISALDDFNGAVWGSDRSYTDTGNRLRAAGDDEALLTQQITITGLSSIWMPAAYEPVRLQASGIIWDAESATLVIREGQDVAPGTRYTVTSSLEAPTRQELLDASPEVPADIAETYTALPPDFSTDIRLLAEQLTAGAPTTYEKALALQSYFLDNFVYSLDVGDGHDTNRMTDFLFQDRRGYCEQFAGTFAAMARSVGLPARVAVGFTPGELVDGVYVVRGEHYHAWPEVWIDGRWVYFEPTPGRGAPGAEQYTGIPQQQAVSGDPGASSSADVPSLEGLSSGNAPVLEEPVNADPGVIEDFSDGGTQGGRVAPWVIRALLAIALLAGLATLWVVALPSLVRLRRRRRHARAGADVRAAVSASWTDLLESLQIAGLPHHASETHREYADRVARRGQVDRGRIEQVAHAADAARYAPGTLDASVAEQTRALVREIEDQLEAGITWQEKLRRRSDPRVLVGS